MPILIACLSGIAVLAVLVLCGIISAADLAHPFWQQKASSVGGLCGLVLSGVVLWLTTSRPGLIRSVTISVALALMIALLVTWRAARKFIDSADFEPVASQIWFLGYHALAALIVAFTSLLVIRLFQRGG